MTCESQDPMDMNNFIAIEIAIHTDIRLHTVLELMTETVDTLPQANFQRLAYFYCTAARQKILSQCSDGRSCYE